METVAALYLAFALLHLVSTLRPDPTFVALTNLATLGVGIALAIMVLA